MLRITAELTKTERDRISTSGPSLQYVTKPEDLFGQISFLFPTRRCTTVDHALVAGGTQRQWHQACLPDGQRLECPLSLPRTT